jgi:hypothetical protein
MTEVCGDNKEVLWVIYIFTKQLPIYGFRLKIKRANKDRNNFYSMAAKST